MSLEGSYELAEAGGRGKATVRVKAEGEGQWRLAVKVANSMGCLITRAGENLTVGPVMSTKARYSLNLNSNQLKYVCVQMMPVPALEQLEREMSELLAGLTDIHLDGADLILKGAGRKERFTLA